MATERERRFVGPRRGQLIFAIFFLAASALLLALIGSETQWVKKTKLVAQPRFWPAVGLGLMTLLSAFHLYRLPWRRTTRYDWREARRWASVLEFAGWFMGYVLAVPVMGYLPVTLVFVPALSWRMDYRSAGMMGLSVIFALVVVVVFKSFLGVKIPGGAIYEYLPDGLRSLFILYF